MQDIKNDNLLSIKFHLIKNKEEVRSFVKELIGKEPISYVEKCEQALLEAIVLYLLKYKDASKQNLATIIEHVKMSDVYTKAEYIALGRDYLKKTSSKLDAVFNAVHEVDRNDICYILYIAYRTFPDDVRRNAVADIILRYAYYPSQESELIRNFERTIEISNNYVKGHSASKEEQNNKVKLQNSFMRQSDESKRKNEKTIASDDVIPGIQFSQDQKDLIAQVVTGSRNGFNYKERR